MAMGEADQEDTLSTISNQEEAAINDSPCSFPSDKCEPGHHVRAARYPRGQWSPTQRFAVL